MTRRLGRVTLSTGVLGAVLLTGTTATAAASITSQGTGRIIEWQFVTRAHSRPAHALALPRRPVRHADGHWLPAPVDNQYQFGFCTL